jgi:AcrR family transcriptional regulator
VAFNIVRDEGGDKLSIRRVAKELTISPMTIYNYVDDIKLLKKEVILRIFSLMYDRLHAKLNGASERTRTLTELCHILALGVFEFACDNPHLFFFVYEKEKQFRHHEETRPFYHFVEYFYRESNQRGPQSETLRRALILFNNVILALIFEHIWEINVLSEDEFAAYVDFFIERCMTNLPES